MRTQDEGEDEDGDEDSLRNRWTSVCYTSVHWPLLLSRRLPGVTVDD